MEGKGLIKYIKKQQNRSKKSENKEENGRKNNGRRETEMMKGE
jgi:hypothetical protein